MSLRLVALGDRYLAECLDKIERATAGLTDEQLWWRANGRSNSIANLLLHLDGNLRQWVLGGLFAEPVEHMSYHTGQIVLLAKALLPEEAELEFYPQHRGE
jgi:hypothetical protein